MPKNSLFNMYNSINCIKPNFKNISNSILENKYQFIEIEKYGRYLSTFLLRYTDIHRLFFPKPYVLNGVTKTIC